MYKIFKLHWEKGRAVRARCIKQIQNQDAAFEYCKKNWPADGNFTGFTGSCYVFGDASATPENILETYN